MFLYTEANCNEMRQKVSDKIIFLNKKTEVEVKALKE